MADLELIRSRDDRRLYEIAGVGSLRFAGLFSRRAIAAAGAARWSFARRGVWQTTIEAFDSTDTIVGSFAARTLRRGGSLRWAERDFELRPARMWAESYALIDDDRELAVLDARSWGKRPVTISIGELGVLEPGLLLFAAFVARQLAEDGAANAGGASTAAATG